MKINITHDRVPFSELESGDVFQHHGKFYIKLGCALPYNTRAINLENGSGFSFGDEELIYPLLKAVLDLNL